MKGKFYSEHLGVTETQGERISNFMSFSEGEFVIEDPSAWGGYNRARVYFDLASQNKIEAINGIEKAYYDADENDIVVERRMPITKVKSPLRSLFDNPQKSLFSGAKTKKWLSDMMERFDAEKESWC